MLALTSYPAEAAATRFRVQQLVQPLHQLGVEVEVRPLLSSEAFRGLYDRGSAGRTAWRLGRAHLRRLRDIADARRADVILLQREAALLGPPVVELLLDVVGRRPIVLDLDDPTWVAYDSPTFGRLGRRLKWPGKADWLIDRAAVVTCGSQAIAAHVEARGREARLVPTVVDTEVFRPRREAGPAGVPVVGWIGSHSTAPYLAGIAPALAAARATAELRVLAVGAGATAIEVAGTSVEQRPWSLEREVFDFQSLDVGLYPLADDEWGRGKSGFKAIQYLACGVPFVVSPVGATCDIGIPGKTHLEARTPAEWAEAVGRLAGDPPLRAAMGAAAREHSLEHYTVGRVATALAAALRAA
ncbi:MAG: glycosyltransferase family 4 protein [Acidimicrobiales bacterium]